MQAASPSVRNWLIVVAAMIFFMITLGALTRLTESGLSMVEWRPITGWLPPLSDQAWHAELQKYAASPQGRIINRGLDVTEFQHIFWLEFLHRLWGRLIGLAFALPLAWFWLRGRLAPELKPRLAIVLVLGGLQGALGWAMVASGLVDRPSVSQYRLAAHLLLAVALFAYIVWVILQIGRTPPMPRRADPLAARLSTALIALLFVVMTWGALMAGLRAGTSHNTFPTMSGYWIPPGMFDRDPWWINLFEDGTTVQFVHRWIAKLLVLGVLALAALRWRRETAAAAAMALLQGCLGVATILTGVNIAIATTHQAGAVLLLTSLLVVRHRANASREEPTSAIVGPLQAPLPEPPEPPAKPSLLMRRSAAAGVLVLVLAGAAILVWRADRENQLAAAPVEAVAVPSSPASATPASPTPAPSTIATAEIDVPAAEPPPPPPTSAEFAKPKPAATRATTAAAVDLTALSYADLRAKADANDVPAMEEVARRLIQGAGIAKDQQAGAGWLLRAAEAGSAQSAFNVGVMYERGFVVERDSTKAVEWYRKAADGNVAMAKHNLALLLRDGKGAPRNGKEAVELLRSAAQQGMSASMFALADIYERGDVAPKDPAMALAWFAITAEFERQANRGTETTLVKTAMQRAQVLQRTLTPAEVTRAQSLGQTEFKQIVDAMAAANPQAVKPAAAAPPREVAAALPPPSPDVDPPGWPKAKVEQIRAIQQGLFDLKRLRDKPDGVIGPVTRTAIRDFQRSVALRETGEASKDVYAALKAALATRDAVASSPLPMPPPSPRAAAEPPKVEAAVPEPPKLDSVKIEPPKPDAAKAEAARAEAAKIEAAKAEAAKAEAAKAEAARTEAAKVEAAKAEAAKAEAARVEAAKVEAAKLEAAKAEAAKLEAAKAEAAKAEAAKAEAARAEAAQAEAAKADAAKKAEAARIEAAKVEAAKAEAAKAEAARAEEAKAEAAKAEAAKAELARADAEKAEAAKAEAAKIEAAKADAAKAEAARVEEAKAEAAKAEAAKTEAAQPAVEKTEPPVTTATAEPPPAPDPNAWPATSSDQVKAIQSLLRELKFYADEPDGDLGPSTQAAIRQYQRAVGERQTGEPSEALFNSLKEMRAVMAPKPG